MKKSIDLTKLLRETISYMREGYILQKSLLLALTRQKTDTQILHSNLHPSLIFRMLVNSGVSEGLVSSIVGFTSLERTEAIEKMETIANVMQLNKEKNEVITKARRREVKRARLLTIISLGTVLLYYFVLLNFQPLAITTRLSLTVLLIVLGTTAFTQLVILTLLMLEDHRVQKAKVLLILVILIQLLISILIIVMGENTGIILPQFDDQLPP